MNPVAVVLVGLVADDPVVLRNRPADEAPAQAELHRGDWLEVRGEVAGFLKVWDHRHERPGYVRPREIRTYASDESSADALATVVTFVRDTTGLESLGIGHAALYVKVASGTRLQGAQGAAVLDALGVMADRLGRRLSSARVASGGTATGATGGADRILAAQLAVAESYGVHYAVRDDGARTAFCYDGEAFARVLGLPAAGPRERVRAVLALTRVGCAVTNLGSVERRAWNSERLRVLAAVPTEGVPAYINHRVRLRRAEALALRAWDEARRNQPENAGRAQADAAAALGGVDRDELAPEDQPTYDAVAVRVAASRWAHLGAATAPTAQTAPAAARTRRPVALVLEPGRPGETCVRLQARGAEPAAAGPTLFHRCTYGVVWPASERWSQAADVLTLAVGTAEAWTELWVLRRDTGGWSVTAVPPAAAEPGADTGYVEVAGFVPGGGVLLAREAVIAGRHQRRFEVRSPDGGLVQKSASRHELLIAFRRFAAPWWRGTSYAAR